ncbi:hypothetical protein BsWGS_19751 [Bradybaena similaris]
MIDVGNIMNIKLPDNNDISHNSLNIPLIGRVHFVRDQEGQYYSLMVLAYWFYGTLSALLIIVIPRFEDGVISASVLYGYLLVAVLCLLSFIRASLTNPGQVPAYLGSEGAQTNWNKCQTCGRMRPPRSHHCRRCGQCVTRMDHHCPWINNCVGESNHFAFMQLLLFAFLLGVFSFILVMCHFWVFPKCVSCNKETFYIKHSIWFMYLEFLLSLNMALMMGLQLFQQHYNLLLNKTTLERIASPLTQDNIRLRKCYNSYREMCGHGLVIFWLCPVGRRRPLLPYALQHPV